MREIGEKGQREGKKAFLGVGKKILEKILTAKTVGRNMLAMKSITTNSFDSNLKVNGRDGSIGNDSALVIERH